MIAHEFALDQATDDLEFPLRILEGGPALLQRIKVRLRWFLGEWFLDQRQGMPYYRDIMVKNPDPILLASIFRQVLLSTPGIVRIGFLTISLDRPTREVRVDFECIGADGTLVTPEAPFIVG